MILVFNIQAFINSVLLVGCVVAFFGLVFSLLEMRQLYKKQFETEKDTKQEEEFFFYGSPEDKQ